MNLLQRLPGSRREPPGLEWKVFRNLPHVFLAGTVLPGLYALYVRLVPDAGSAQEIARQIQLTDFLVFGTIILHWAFVLTVTIYCVIVILMKGPAYVADRYDLPDRDEPHNPGS
jgi:hypothetical protein